MRNSYHPLFTLLALAFLSAGCASKNGSDQASKAPPPPLSTEVHMGAASKSHVEGELKVEDHFGGILITGKITGLKKGLHGFHIHEKADCSAKDASSAGGHFHKDGEVHGAPGEKTSHAGDLGNIEADNDGTADVHLYVKGLQLGAGENSVAGRSLIIHALPDDLKSQPAGNSGARVACGAIDVKAISCNCSHEEGKDEKTLKCHCHDKHHHHHHHEGDDKEKSPAKDEARH